MDELREQARSSYERGRWRLALPWTLPVLGMGVVSVAFAGAAAAVVGLVAAAVVCTLRVAGGLGGRAVLAGLPAGGLTWGLVTVWSAQADCCGACTSACLVACGGAGLAGLVVLLRRASDPMTLVVASVVASLVASMACLSMGVAGLGLAVAGLSLAWPVDRVLRA